jgi:hypothetical protein
VCKLESPGPVARRAAWEPCRDQSGIGSRGCADREPVPARTARAELDAYRRFLETRLSRFHAMAHAPAQSGNIFPQLILRRSITRIDATLVWVEEASKALDAGHQRQLGPVE